jgi:TRAP-type mannitol/chloroaromatic compound transport system permease large subunit
VPIGQIYRGVAPFLISLIFVWGLLFLIPQMALWLPSVFFK